MKQARFPWFNDAQEPRDVPAAFVLACGSEAQAVRDSLAIAKKAYGRSLAQVAKLCGWKSPSFLSEIARETNEKNMPPDRRDAFAYATGCNLILQYHDKVSESHRLAGKQTEREKSEAVAVACIAQWEKAA